MIEEIIHCDKTFCEKTKKKNQDFGWYVLSSLEPRFGEEKVWHFCCLDHVSEQAYCMGGSNRCK